MSDAKKLFYFQWMITTAILLFFVYLAWQAWPQMIIKEESMRWSPDTDPWLRLTLVRDWLAEGGWYFDREMTRSNAPFGGNQSPWTKPLDVILVSLASVMQGDTSARLIKAALCLSPIMAGLWVFGLMQAAKKLMPTPDHLLLAFLMLCLFPLSWNYFGVAAADHHSVLAVCFIWLIVIILGKHSGLSALVAGGIAGLMVWISVEAFIPLTILIGCCGLLWIYGKFSALFLKYLLAALAVTTTFAVMIERPPHLWFAAFYDTISFVHVVAFWLAACAFIVLCALPLTSALSRAVSAFIVIVVITAMMWIAFPLFFSGPMVGLHPYIFSDFLPVVTEAQPLWGDMTQWHEISYAAHPLIALALILQILKSSSWRMYGNHAFMLLSLTVLLIAACLIQGRWFYYLAPIMAFVFSVPLACLFFPNHPSVNHLWPARAISLLPLQKHAAVRLVCVAFLAGVGLLPTFLSNHTSPTNGLQNPAEVSLPCQSIARAIIRSGELVKAVGSHPLTILTPTNLGTEILFFTPHRIIASNYHREGAAIQYVFESNAVVEAAALKSYLSARKVDILLICPPPVTPKGGLIEQIALSTSDAPEWMRPIDIALPKWDSMQELLKEKPALPKVYRIAP